MPNISSLSKQEKMFTLAREWVEGDLRKADICFREGISENSLSYWIQKYRKQNPPEITADFISLEINPESEKVQTKKLTLKYPNSVELIFDSEIDIPFLHTLITII